ncbi:transcription factor Adf-1-like [Monomorium pharaonis]|uniref:transcription factor Adf-1-like n=1 Tax=Monomorium pharaonis TaxID=307658 RepID=UPI0017470A20|nr:transcription factor Adf-1-like [Monomorium pharaonis]
MNVQINDADLILWVEQFRHLYDKKEKDYKNKNVVENSWQFIGNKLNASSSECRDRWIALRNRFSKERCKLIRSGSGASDQKEWPLMKNLAFLHECVKRRKTFSNVESPCKDTEDSSCSMLSNDSYAKDSQNLAQKHNAAEELDYEDVQYLDETPNEYVEYLDEQTGTHKDFDDVSMDETSQETINRTSRETTQSPAAKRSRSRSTTPSDKGSSNKASFQAKMDEAVDIFQKFVTERNTLTAEDNSLKNFCNSIYADLKNLDNRQLIHCKIEIMQVIAKYLE